MDNQKNTFKKKQTKKKKAKK